MTLLSLEDCRMQCRVDGEYDDTLLLALRDAAEDAVAAQLHRDVFPDAVALAHAQSVLPEELGAAEAAYQQALTAAGQLGSDSAQAKAMVAVAQSQWNRAQLRAWRIREGIVVNGSILAAIRLTMGHLYAHREAVVSGVTATELPLGVEALVRPYRLVLMP